MTSPLHTIWTHVHPAVCSLVFKVGNNRISSGSGFKIGQRLLTNNHVVQVPGATHVTLRFVGADGSSDTASRTLTIQELQAKLLDGDPADAWDFAIYDLSWPEFAKTPSLALAPATSTSIGDPVALFGFQFDQSNLSVHAGVLASRFVQKGVKYLQIDASVNQGNSGGPLIDLSTCLVIGIVTRKATGLTQEFDALLHSFDQNIQALKGSQGAMRVGPIDPFEVLMVSQEQMKRVSLEIRRSANVGIGYAYELDKVRGSSALNN